MGHLSSLHRFAALACGAFILAVGVTSPLRVAALSGITRGFRSQALAGARTSKLGEHRLARHVSPNGYWHTEGNRVVSERRTPVRLAGVNWSGLETTALMPGGLNRQDYHTILRTIADAGYNTIRIPFSNEVIEHPSVPSALRFENETGSINGDLEGLTSVQILDHIIFAAGELGLKVVLDNHRSEAGSSAEGNGLWYTDEYPEEAWIADWVSLAARYKGNATVIGFDLRNEPHNANSGGACWDCGGARDWHLAAERAGNSVLRTNPNLLIFVEGTDAVDGRSDFWGGNLAGVSRSPVRLSVQNRLVYSPHVYGPAEFQQPWFNSSTTPSSLMTNWRHSWGFINETGTAPVWIGEFGTLNDDASVVSTDPGSEGQYFSTLIAYLQSHPEVGWSYWGLNGEDRYGLLDPSYSAPANEQKAMALARIRPLSMPSASPSRTSVLAAGDVPTSRTEARLVRPRVMDRMFAAVRPHARNSAAPATASIQVIYAAPALSHEANFSAGNPEGRSTLRARSAHAGPHSSNDLIAEQVRVATQQALRDLPPED